MCKNCAKHIVYITSTKFQWRTINMPIYKTLENSWILNILRNESIFLYSKRPFFFRRIGVFTSLDVAIFRVTLRDCAQIFLKGSNLKKWWLSLFSFALHGSNVKSEKNVTWKNISYSVWSLLQCKLNKTKLTSWKRDRTNMFVEN